MAKGTRHFKGIEFLLCGRTHSKENATAERKALLDSWSRVRIVKFSDWDFMLYVHGRK